jgi:hypothetical protein
MRSLTEGDLGKPLLRGVSERVYLTEEIAELERRERSVATFHFYKGLTLDWQSPWSIGGGGSSDRAPRPEQAAGTPQELGSTISFLWRLAGASCWA